MSIPVLEYIKKNYKDHALSVDKLTLDEKASPTLVGFMIGANTIAKATIVSYYQR